MSIYMLPNNENSCRKMNKDKITVLSENCRSRKRELFVFELNVSESVSSHKNILIPRHVK